MGLLAHHQCVDCLALPFGARPDRPRRTEEDDDGQQRCATHRRAGRRAAEEDR